MGQRANGDVWIVILPTDSPHPAATGAAAALPVPATGAELLARLRGRMSAVLGSHCVAPGSPLEALAKQSVVLRVGGAPAAEAARVAAEIAAVMLG
jgi:hypothetical protein